MGMGGLEMAGWGGGIRLNDPNAPNVEDGAGLNEPIEAAIDEMMYMGHFEPGNLDEAMDGEEYNPDFEAMMEENDDPLAFDAAALDARLQAIIERDVVDAFQGEFGTVMWYIGTTASAVPNLSRACQFLRPVHFADMIRETAGMWRLDEQLIESASFVMTLNGKVKSAHVVENEEEWQGFVSTLEHWLGSGKQMSPVVVTLNITEALPDHHHARIFSGPVAGL